MDTKPARARSRANARRAPPAADTFLRRSFAGKWADAARLRATQILLAAGLVAGILLSFPLWLSDRDFPLLPLLPFIPPLPYPLDVLVLVAVLVLALAIAGRARPQIETVALAALLVVLVAQDRTRCQPWLYQYILMLLVTSLARSDRVALDTLRLLMAAVYTWSGVHKLNLVFFADAAPWLLEPFLGTEAAGTIAVVGYVFPAIEMGIGIGLLVPRARDLALGLGIAMHLVILYAIGPLGHDVNSVVWPWNVVMIALLWVLFRGIEPIATRVHAGAPPRMLRWAVLAAFWLLPALSFARLWNIDLSWGLYSGLAREGTAYVTPSAVDCLPATVRRHLEPIDGGYALSMWRWAMATTNVPLPAERWTFRRLRDRLCTCDPEGRRIVFALWEPRRWQLPIPVEEYRCGEPWP